MVVCGARVCVCYMGDDDDVQALRLYIVAARIAGAMHDDVVCYVRTPSSCVGVCVGRKRKSRYVQLGEVAIGKNSDRIAGGLWVVAMVSCAFARCVALRFSREFLRHTKCSCDGGFYKSWCCVYCIYVAAGEQHARFGMCTHATLDETENKGT